MGSIQFVKFKRLDPKAIEPEFGSEYSAGADIRCLDAVIIPPDTTHIISTGLAVALPPRTAMMVLPRSGLSVKTDFHIKNSPGLIDSDYRGEVKIIAKNMSHRWPCSFAAGDRIAQVVVVPYIPVRYIEVEDLPETDRGENGFGSTGVK